ncbi:AAA family ATPase [Deinococcus peraridilitoris]|uniref:ATPase with chaperone activity, ATP-binding subunit n=1 Tax=Deinococcus peraridilitoris (strain DSM 19664 / LMG 22246 / CIP 109416 / KR-200) TaxID=937777 RepID=L0A468_DEIPD|nr:AAA family ATPase [Deinococcus peraridilitoris]AFZ68626.1 ATPase with chaperone activity, ATP-binding subunit [Deinococcus peraridilitoris DSM 19664]
MLSENLQSSLKRALELAREHAHDFVTLEHLLLALVDDPEAGAALRALGADLGRLRNELTAFIADFETGDEEPEFTLGTQRAVQRAALQLRAAGKTGESADGARVLAEVLDEEDSFARYVLEAQGVTRLSVLSFISHGASGAPRRTKGVDNHEDDGLSGEAVQNPLDAYCENLTQAARDGKLDRMIGRSAELERMVHILARRAKHNPVLVGEPGVGKTAVVEGLAQRIAQDEVPEVLQGAQVYALDMGALLAGTRFRGDFEERIKQVLSALSGQKALLFIDELHTIVGAGAVQGGAMDAANLLKPALARGELRVVGATTPSEVRHLQGDRALWRRFQTVDIAEPSEDEALEILRGLAPVYEAHHGVKYPQDALQTAVALSSRYLRDRFLPDKAIDVMDEAGAAHAVRARPAKTGRRKKAATVTVADMEATVARMARIPVGSVKGQEVASLATLEDDLRAGVFGQEGAVKTLASAVKLARAGLRDPQKPQGNFLFAGPTGVGKTELARTLARVLGVELIRFDMSEYQEAHTVARLIGAPPGYVGFDQGGLLTEALSKNPHAVILLDEVEKAHPDIYNLLLQVMDHGTLTDHTGKQVNFRGAILIMTSNAGAADASRPALGFGRTMRIGEEREAIERTFTPEFRNRLDAVLSFAPLSRDVMGRVVDKFLRELEGQLREKRVTLTVTPAARVLLAQLGYDPAMGARPLGRVIEERVKRPLADELLFGQLQQGGTVTVDAQGETLSFRYG